MDAIRKSDTKGLEISLEHGLVALPNTHDENELFLNTQSHLGMLPMEHGTAKQPASDATKSPHLVSTWGRRHPNVQFGDKSNAVTVLDLGGKRLHKGFPCNPQDSVGAFACLNTLNLAGTDLTLQDIMRILALPNVVETVECLYLGGNCLGDDGAKAIAAQFLASARRLRKLDLRYNDIQVAGMQAICEALLESNVEYLYLEGNQVGNDGAKALANLLEQQALSECNALREVFLGANKIQADGAKFLAEILHQNKYLSKLYLEGNDIGLQGANAFSTVLEALQGDTGLKHLFVDNNNIGKEGSKRLAKALKSGTAIGESMLE